MLPLSGHAVTQESLPAPTGTAYTLHPRTAVASPLPHFSVGATQASKQYVHHHVDPAQRLARQPAPPRPFRQRALKRVRAGEREHKHLDAIDEDERFGARENDPLPRHQAPERKHHAQPGCGQRHQVDRPGSFQAYPSWIARKRWPARRARLAN
eukprot:631038-Prymnesium_polylepis.1